MKAVIIAIVICFLFTPIRETKTTTEYMQITEIQPYSAELDVVTVCNANGDESQFFADTHTFIGGDFIKVTIDHEGRVIDAQ